MFDHTADWYKFNLDRENSLVLFFEDMKKNLKSSVIQIAKFLDKKLSAKAIDGIVELTTFKNMQKNDNFNLANLPNFKHEKSPFMRKGQVGDWFQYFTDEQNVYIDNKCEQFKNIGLTFEYY